ncbi:MAG TPA: DUF4364 family protein [Thermoproteales archaeon]|nr:DUF4364 family protein [Thermoproteales archaeon]
MKKRRSKLRILADILKVVESENGARITQILYGANLSYERLTKYLKELKEKGLLVEREENGVTRYYLTHKGMEFLREFRRISRFAEAFGIEL